MALAFAIALAAVAFGLAIVLAIRSGRRELRSTSAEAADQAQPDSNYEGPDESNSPHASGGQ